LAAQPICGCTPGILEKEKFAPPPLYQTSLARSPTSHASRLFSMSVTRLSLEESFSAKNAAGKVIEYGVGPLVTKRFVPGTLQIHQPSMKAILSGPTKPASVIVVSTLVARFTR
jgi:hypothetical protein